MQCMHTCVSYEVCAHAFLSWSCWLMFPEYSYVHTRWSCEGPQMLPICSPHILNMVMCTHIDPVKGHKCSQMLPTYSGKCSPWKPSFLQPSPIYQQPLFNVHAGPPSAPSPPPSRDSSDSESDCPSSSLGYKCSGSVRGACILAARILWVCLHVFCRVGQNHICTPCMTVHLVIFLPKLPYMHRIFMVLVNPIVLVCRSCPQIVHHHLLATAATAVCGVSCRAQTRVPLILSYSYVAA